MSEIAKIIVEGKEYEFPVIVGTEGEKAIDISKLRDLTGHITLDIGFKNTGSTKSAITFLDGELGILHHRGYSIEDLAEHASFLEVSYLLQNSKMRFANTLWLTKVWKPCSKHSQQGLTQWVSYLVWLPHWDYTILRP